MEGYSLESSVLEKINIMSQRTIKELLNKWSSMYRMSDEMKAHWFDQFLSHIKELYSDMLAAEEEKMKGYMKEINKKLKDCRHFEKVFKVTEQYNIDCSQEPLTKIIQELDEVLKVYEEKKVEIMNKLDLLKSKEANLCKCLGFTELVINNEIPSEVDFSRLEHQIFIYEEIKNERMITYQNSRENIIEYIHKLEILELNHFETSLVNSNSIHSLSSNSLDKLIEREEFYVKQYSSIKVTIEDMLQELKILWIRLDVPDDYQQDFIVRHTGINQRVEASIQTEIFRCKQIRHANFKTLIKKTRDQIHIICDKLCYTAEEESKHMYSSSFCSKDLLDILETELSKLELIYNQDSDLIETAREQRAMEEQRQELEKSAKDKSLLFSNRGGKLLQIEKDRKMVEQALPKLTKKLKDKLLEYESRNGKAFLYYGRNLLLLLGNDS